MIWRSSGRLGCRINQFFPKTLFEASSLKSMLTTSKRCSVGSPAKRCFWRVSARLVLLVETSAVSSRTWRIDSGIESFPDFEGIKTASPAKSEGEGWAEQSPCPTESNRPGRLTRGPTPGVTSGVLPTKCPNPRPRRRQTLAIHHSERPRSVFTAQGHDTTPLPIPDHQPPHSRFVRLPCAPLTPSPAGPSAVDRAMPCSLPSHACEPGSARSAPAPRCWRSL